MNYQIIYVDELYHHGVPGMKWGKRTARPVSTERGNMAKAKVQYKQDKKSYGKAYNKAYVHSMSIHVTKKGRLKNKKLWENTIDAYNKQRKSKNAYKEAKNAYKNTSEYKTKRAKAVKRGAAAVGTALAAYGTYKAAKFIGNKHNVSGKLKSKAYNKAIRRNVKELANMKKKGTYDNATHQAKRMARYAKETRAASKSAGSAIRYIARHPFA